MMNDDSSAPQVDAPTTQSSSPISSWFSSIHQTADQVVQQAQTLAEVASQAVQTSIDQASEAVQQSATQLTPMTEKIQTTAD